jgi:hypothetical protein
MRTPLRELPAFAGVAAAQLVVFALLAASGSWHAKGSDLTIGALLVCAEAVLIYEFGRTLGGSRFGFLAAGVWIAAPALLLRYWVSGGGSPPVPFSPVYHDVYLPQGFGVHSHAGVAAACLLLLACRLSLAAFRGNVPVALAAGLAAGGAALVEPRAWPALAAPALALLAARRPAACAAAAAGAAAGLAALLVFRHVPGIHPGYHRMGTTLANVREFAWSLRVLEYLPLAGLVGIARRSAPAAVLLGWVLLTLVILPLGYTWPEHRTGLVSFFTDIRPGLPVYALLAASLPFLVPRSAQAALRARVALPSKR